jgi:hypothetical protein
MIKRRNAITAAIAGATMLLGSASAVAEVGTVNTTDGGERGGHALYSTSTQRDPDSGGRTTRTRVALKACDDERDGYGVVVVLYDADAGVGERALLGQATDRNGAENRCGKKRVFSHTGPMEIQVYLHDGDGKEHTPEKHTAGHSEFERIA